MLGNEEDVSVENKDLKTTQIVVRLDRPDLFGNKTAPKATQTPFSRKEPSQSLWFQSPTHSVTESDPH